MKNYEKLECREVKSGVPQRSVLALLMFLVYVNNMTEGVSRCRRLFADDARLLRKIINPKDCKKLQNDINKIYKWSTTWEIEFNTKKCHASEIEKSGMTHIDIQVRTKYSINRRRREGFGNGNTRQLITRETYRSNIRRHIQDAKNYMDGFSLPR